MAGAFQQAQNPSPQMAQMPIEEPEMAMPQPGVTEPQPEQGEPMTPDFAQESLVNESEATDAEEQELERALDALGDVLYSDDKSHQVIIDQFSLQDKVGSVATASLELIKNLDAKLDLDETVIPTFTQEVVGRMIDLFENVHSEQLEEPEAQAVLASTWEGVLAAFGVEQDDYDEFLNGMSSQQVTRAQQGYNKLLEGYNPSG